MNERVKIADVEGLVEEKSSTFFLHQFFGVNAYFTLAPFYSWGDTKAYEQMVATFRHFQFHYLSRDGRVAHLYLAFCPCSYIIAFLSFQGIYDFG
jgi:hypothetical protein